MSRRHGAALDLQDLPPAVAAALEAALDGEEVTLSRAGEPLGTLVVRSSILEGSIIGGPAPPPERRQVPEGVTVVATAMELSERVRGHLAEGLGTDYLVLDLHEAPPSADVLLVPPISPQLLDALRDRFPTARVLVTEIEDEELDVHYRGPVSRMLAAGASGYLPPRPIAELALTVHAHLARLDLLAVAAAPRTSPTSAQLEDRSHRGPATSEE
ncbi:response regulator transcription factor [Brachybacterium sp. YJGR34]|uniref:response regulator transcription factor n=1 Tax=Brachybacterium sp. YJGR34 TaxID=2059911 RepID=UPI000E0BE7FB|nr:response regulator transcription factor [Brachybacterium sp. YJGR34]